MSASQYALVLAILAQLVFTFAVMTRAAVARFRAGKARRVRLAAIALSNESWPDDVKKLGNSMNNQFETPTLFYAISILAIVLGKVGPAMAVLAWLWLATRIAHMVVHTGTNVVTRRFAVFMAGAAVLIAMTVLLAIAVVSEGWQAG